MREDGPYLEFIRDSIGLIEEQLGAATTLDLIWEAISVHLPALEAVVNAEKGLFED